MNEKVLVVGGGGLGGIVSAYLSEQGVDVTTLTRNPVVVDAVNAMGFRLCGATENRTVKGRAVSSLPMGERYGIVVLATQPTDVEAATAQVLPVLADDGVVVVLQNGLCEERVARLMGDGSRVVGLIVAWGGRMVEPGLYDRTSSGGMTMGSLEQTNEDRVRFIQSAFSSIGPVERTDNLLGARWSKLIINCAVSSLGTLNGTELGPVVWTRRGRRIALGIMTEGEQVARHLGVKLEKVSGTLDLNWMAMSPKECQGGLSVGLLAKHAMIMAVGMKYRRLYSSMLRAIEAGKTPAVAYLNGEIVDAGRKVGVKTPINEAVCSLIWSMAGGEHQPGPHLIDDVFGIMAQS